jgi:DMSO/TMAO reductase YedYZ molybdopterin-dependent catalytic subunit
MNKPLLPPGQYEIAEFPRFGMTRFADRQPETAGPIKVEITGDVLRPQAISAQFARLTRIEQQSDFHCVTTWSCRSLRWSGYTFLDFYRYFAIPLAGANPNATFVVLHGQDGYRTSLPLADLLASDVLLADRLDGEPLSMEHGGPMRLVAPAHYGYKSVKHISSVEFRYTDDGYRPLGLRFMTHPRARVAQEERGQWFPGWLLRYLYRPLVQPTIKRFLRIGQRDPAEIGRAPR